MRISNGGNVEYYIDTSYLICLTSKQDVSSSALDFLEEKLSSGDHFVTGTITFLEWERAGSAIGRSRESILADCEILESLFAEVFPFGWKDWQRARSYSDGHGLSLSLACHAASARGNGVDRILSIRNDYRKVPGLTPAGPILTEGDTWKKRLH